MKRIALLATGGTISMKRDSITGLAVPTLSGIELLEQIPEPLLDCDVDVVEMDRVGGGQLTTTLFFKIAETIRDLVRTNDYQGFVITQGTDAMEESGYLLDLLLDIPHPVVITGSMRNASELGYDGIANLHQALMVANCPDSWDRGVTIVLSNEIHSAVDAVKTDTSHLQTFESPGKGPMGRIMKNVVSYFHEPRQKKDHYKAKHVESRVVIIKAGIGEDGQIFKQIPPDLVDGYVIEGTGVGNGQYWMEEWIEEQVQLGKPVIITSRCPNGFVDMVYGYPGSSSRLIQKGAIQGIGLNSMKARMKLIAILGQTKDMTQIKKFFEGCDISYEKPEFNIK
ncbi:asparaginase [Evansella sp. AB-P1]|uniref:asparaginase n=1 Tax=Evansella sp. AB-P1 TaxID=3037653 RepID=UPI00241F2C87|nr:asparaginase [Evansella sp. AB-P1]MDG5789384.1 asparaginase [Evansella sp. AB-P1]